MPTQCGSMLLLVGGTGKPSPVCAPRLSQWMSNRCCLWSTPTEKTPWWTSVAMDSMVFIETSDRVFASATWPRLLQSVASGVNDAVPYPTPIDGTDSVRSASMSSNTKCIVIEPETKARPRCSIPVMLSISKCMP